MAVRPSDRSYCQLPKTPSTETGPTDDKNDGMLVEMASEPPPSPMTPPTRDALSELAMFDTTGMELTFDVPSPSVDTATFDMNCVVTSMLRYKKSKKLNNQTTATAIAKFLTTTDGTDMTAVLEQLLAEILRTRRRRCVPKLCVP